MNIYAKTIREYDNEITERALDLLERHGANKKYFWLVCAGRDFICWVESGNVFGYREYHSEQEFREACKQLAEDLKIPY